MAWTRISSSGIGMRSAESGRTSTSRKLCCALATTTPPQSPVAWSTFITGLDPEAHGIFDFVDRDPATLEPFSSMSQVEDPRFRIPLGPYEIPLSHARVASLRKGKAFWEFLSERGNPGHNRPHARPTIRRSPTAKRWREWARPTFAARRALSATTRTILRRFPDPVDGGDHC